MRTITKAEKPKITGRGRTPDKAATDLAGKIVAGLEKGDEDTVIALAAADLSKVGKADASLVSKRGTLKRACDRVKPDFVKLSGVGDEIFAERNGEDS